MKPYIHKVNYYETDKMGITHHSNYVRFMEEARVDFLDQLGWSFDKLEAKGLVSPVLSLDCTFKKSTKFADAIECLVKVEKLSALKLTLAYEFTCGGDLVFTGTPQGVGEVHVGDGLELFLEEEIVLRFGVK